MGKHTSGPWEILGLNRGPHAGTIAITLPGYGISLTGSTLIASVCGKADEQEANARLIAAAPDMADALKELIIAADPETNMSMIVLKDALSVARAALTKAGVLS